VIRQSGWSAAKKAANSNNAFYTDINGTGPSTRVCWAFTFIMCNVRGYGCETWSLTLRDYVEGVKENIRVYERRGKRGIEKTT
jgi:hypothetical protein